MIDPKVYRSTMGLCLGLRGGLSSAIVVISCRRDDPARTLYVTHEWEQTSLNVDAIAEALSYARKTFHTVFTTGYYGGRDDEKTFKVLSVRLGQHIEPAPGDTIAPMQLLIDDFRSGRLKAKPDSLTVRDASSVIWRDGTPDHTGVMSALRCAHWSAQQYRQRLKKPTAPGDKVSAITKERIQRKERPF